MATFFTFIKNETDTEKKSPLRRLKRPIRYLTNERRCSILFLGGDGMKRIFIFILCFVLLCTPVWVQGAQSVPVVTKGELGDVNLDGSVNSLDALLVLQVSVGKCPNLDLVKQTTDINGNQTTEAADALEILRYIVYKNSVVDQNRVQTSVGYGDSYAFWDVLEDDCFTTQQAWLCQSYEEYVAFMNLGYVKESDRRVGRDTAQITPQFDQAFFETHSLVLWYRPCVNTEFGVHYQSAYVQNGCVYLFFEPYSPYDNVDYFHKTQDEIYGFWFQKGETPCSTVVMKQTLFEAMYLWTELVQFEFPTP